MFLKERNQKRKVQIVANYYHDRPHQLSDFYPD